MSEEELKRPYPVVSRDGTISIVRQDEIEPDPPDCWRGPALGDFHHELYLEYARKLLASGTPVFFSDGYGDSCWHVPLLDCLEILGAGTYRVDAYLAEQHLQRTLRRAWKMWPCSTEMARAVELEEEEPNEPEGGDVEPIDSVDEMLSPEYSQ